MIVCRDKRFNIMFQKRSKFPQLSDQMLELLQFVGNGDIQVVLEKILNLIGNYSFDSTYLREINDRTFELKTTDGKLINVHLEPGDIDNCPQIMITEDNIKTVYDYIIGTGGKKNKLFLETNKQIDLNTGFTQFYYCRYDEVAMKKDGLVTLIYFYNPNLEKEYDKMVKQLFFVSDKLKEAVKNTDFTDIVKTYNDIVLNLDENVKSFEILIYDDKTYKHIDNVVVSNGELKYLLLTKKHPGGFVTIEEDNRRDKQSFSAVINNVRINYDDTLSEFDEIKNEMQKKLIMEVNK